MCTRVLGSPAASGVIIRFFNNPAATVFFMFHAAVLLDFSTQHYTTTAGKTLYGLYKSRTMWLLLHTQSATYDLLHAFLLPCNSGCNAHSSGDGGTAVTQ